MEARLTWETFPVFVLDVPKSETDFVDVPSIVAHFETMIRRHPSARFLGVFDHFDHTRALPDGEVDEAIVDARCVMFCFGISIPSPEILAQRPRSIGIAELRDRFVVSFLEVPMPLANAAVEAWAFAILRNAPRAAARGATDIGNSHPIASSQ